MEGYCRGTDGVSKWLNGLHPRLKFTIEYSESSIVFLDLKLSVQGNTVVSEMYSKSSDTHAYLMPTSCHPTHICRNIPNGVMKRVKRNCSDPDTCASTYEEYKTYLQNRGYHDDLINSAIKAAEATPRESLIMKPEKSESKSSASYPMVMKFNPRLPPMAKFINKHIGILALTEETANMFHKSSLFVSYKMEKNILSLTTRNKFQSPEGPSLADAVEAPEMGCFGCPAKCTLCKNFLVECKEFSSSKINQTYKIKSYIDCNTRNVIYMITDKICKDVFYIGYSERSMAERWRNHKSDIKLGRKSCEIATHFKDLKKSSHRLCTENLTTFTSQLSEQLEVTILESVEVIPGRDTKAFLHERENFWQATLKSTNFYGGINKRSNKS